MGEDEEVAKKPAAPDEEEDEEDEDEEEEEDEEEDEEVAKKPAAPKAMRAAMKAPARKGVFEIFKGKGGKYYFRLRAANKEIILQSQGYTANSGAMHGVESVKKNAKASQ